MNTIFKNILLLGRPASGKSEFIDFMKNIPVETRAEKYHIGIFKELDDFPWIWEKFMEDNIWEKAGYPRRYSFGGDSPGLLKEAGALFDFCIQKFNTEYTEYTEYKEGTLIVEFSRGGAEGYTKALSQLSPEILKNAVILFIDVSYEESCRRNNARYQEKLKHSVLAHKVPDETLQHFYHTHDWGVLTEDKESGYLRVQGVKVPFVTMNNEPELTDPVLLDQRYGKALRQLMELNEQSI